MQHIRKGSELILFILLKMKGYSNPAALTFFHPSDASYTAKNTAHAFLKSYFKLSKTGSQLWFHMQLSFRSV